MAEREKVIKALEERISTCSMIGDGFDVVLNWKLADDVLALLKEQEGLMLALDQSNAANEYLNAEVERLTGLLKEQEEAIPVSWLESYTRLKCMGYIHDIMLDLIKTWKLSK